MDGKKVFSFFLLLGKYCPRCAIVNHARQHCHFAEPPPDRDASLASSFNTLMLGALFADMRRWSRGCAFYFLIQVALEIKHQMFCSCSTYLLFVAQSFLLKYDNAASIATKYRSRVMQCVMFVFIASSQLLH